MVIHVEDVGPAEFRGWNLKHIAQVGDVSVVEIPYYGRGIILDGRLQSVTADHHIVHEMHTHPILTLPRKFEKILIMGGGEGALAQECLKHSSVESVINVDISSDIIEACKKYLPEMNEDAYSDPRFKMMCEDAWIHNLCGKHDLIICNIQTCGNTEDEQFLLFNKGSFQSLSDGLTPSGWMVFGLYTTFYSDQRKIMEDALDALTQVFSSVSACHFMVPSYGCEEILLYCTNSTDKHLSELRHFKPPENLKTYTQDFFKASCVFPPHLIIDKYKHIFGVK